MAENIDFSGVHTALATPFDKDGEVSYGCLERLVNFQISEGINGIVPVGTTGETPTLSTGEHLSVVKRTVEIADGRIPIIAGAGSNSTREAVNLTKEAAAAGADAILQVTPYYNKPNQEGLFLHFSAIAEATNKPIVLYSIPSRCMIQLDPDTVARLYEKYPHVCVIKESSGKPERVEALRAACGDAFTILSGDDSMTLQFIERSASGVISVASNALIRPLLQLVKLTEQGERAASMELDKKLQHFFEALFLDPNPVPIKHVLVWKQLIESPRARLPLTKITDSTLRELEAAWEEVKDL
ncbi:MAG: 4-hydroxy-tetrahydrodipicolinate synthase [Opitutales bacterium]|nr:4-hydroxy-tetrahydrodipicolinate synthase [Opitutales bacterium]NRA26995.1 4-hydroxy-tetrahydrodipicolinate synthase [Opitutales bacterium]